MARVRHIVFQETPFRSVNAFSDIDSAGNVGTE